jgi:hypothetical protein
MPNFDAVSLLRWFHFLMLVVAGGAMPICLLLSGFEDTHEDVRGLAAGVWRKIAVWGMRLAIFFGVAVFVASIVKGGEPFTQPHLMFKIGMAPILVLLCETTPKKLGEGKRGSAMGAIILFLLTSFVASNGNAFFRAKPQLPTPIETAIPLEYPTAPEQVQDSPSEPKTKE